LQLATTGQCLYEDFDAGLCCLAAATDAVKKTLAIEILDACDAGGIGLRLKISPLRQL